MLNYLCISPKISLQVFTELSDTGIPQLRQFLRQLVHKQRWWIVESHSYNVSQLVFDMLASVTHEGTKVSEPI